MKLNHEQVKEILPHRHPLLLVDEATEVEPGVRAKTTLYVDPDWDIFPGHFPGDPVFPGIYSIETMAQTTDLVLLTKPEYAGKEPLLLGADRAKFYKKIVPGDTLEVQAELIYEREEKAIGTCQCAIRANGELMATVDITIAVR